MCIRDSDIPEEVVRRRYTRSLDNLVNLFFPITDYWFILNNSENKPKLIAEGRLKNNKIIYDKDKWSIINEYSKNK